MPTGTEVVDAQPQGTGFEPKDCLVGWLDVLGFKGLVRNSMMAGDSNRLGMTLNKVFQDLPYYIKGEPSEYFGDCTYGGPNPRPPVQKIVKRLLDARIHFSDTILFLAEVDLDDYAEFETTLHSMCVVLNSFIQSSILFPGQKTRSLAFRGAIAYGPLVRIPRDNIYFGIPIIDAYELAEEQNWHGGAIHQSVRVDLVINKVGNKYLEGFDGQLVRYEDVPVDKNLFPEIKYALNWVQMHPACKEYYSKIATRKPLRQDLIDGNLDHYDWGSDNLKKANTVKFAESICRSYARDDRYHDYYSE